MTSWLIPPVMVGAMLLILAAMRLAFHALERIDEPHEIAALKAAWRLRFNRKALYNKKTGLPIHFAHRNKDAFQWSGCAALHYGRLMNEDCDKKRAAK